MNRKAYSFLILILADGCTRLPSVRTRLLVMQTMPAVTLQTPMLIFA